MAKQCPSLNVNERTDEPEKMTSVDFVISDNTHLTASGVQYLAKRVRTLFLVTANPKHPAHHLIIPNMHVLAYDTQIDFAHLFTILNQTYHIPKVTIQSGGTMNAVLLRQ